MTENAGPLGRYVHIVSLACKDEESTLRCLDALRAYGRPDATDFGCLSYEFGRVAGHPHTVQIVERWDQWENLNNLLAEKVVPALPLYNQMLSRPFDPSLDTLRIELIP